jgi:hypothetical protein
LGREDLVGVWDYSARDDERETEVERDAPICCDRCCGLFARAAACVLRHCVAAAAASAWKGAGGAHEAVGPCTRGLFWFNAFILLFKLHDFVLVGGQFW